MLVNSCSKDDDKIITTTTPLKDIDGNVYDTVIIGTQVWMAENLKTINLNDGTAIPLVTDSKEWGNLITLGYCWYANDPVTYEDTYGALYNWYTVNTEKLCPSGWHVPTDGEWETLATFLGGDSIAGGKLKETVTTHWEFPNTGATNVSGFTALPSAYRDTIGSYMSIEKSGYWWSSTAISKVSAWNRTMSYASKSLSKDPSFVQNGFAVRCIKD